MHQLGPYLFKFADTEAEFEQIHRLNFQTFVREIPQHHDRGGDALVDKFHHKNRYLIAVRDDRVVGMLCTHDEPPFSVADRLTDPSILTAPGVRPLEVRLLAVNPGERHNAVVLGMILDLNEYAQRDGYLPDAIHISPTQVKIGSAKNSPRPACGEAAWIESRTTGA